MADSLSRMPLDNPMLSAALAYASNGHRVHPLYYIRDDGKCSCGRNECKAGKHPKLSGWQTKATTNRDQIIKWWADSPDNRNASKSNIGLLPDDGYVLIDVDPHNGGSLDAAIKEHPSLQAVFDVVHTTKSGSGDGRHYKFKNSGKNVRVRKGTSKLGKGVDIISGRSAYVVAPPSNHVSGNLYEFMGGEIMELPDDLRGLCEQVNAKAKIPADADIPEGTRNSELASQAGIIYRKGLSFKEGYLELIEMNEYRCKPPLPHEEVKTIAKNIHALSMQDKTSIKTLWQIAVTRDYSLPQGIRITLINLSHYMNEHGKKCYPSQDKMAEDIGVRRQTIAKHLEYAIEAGYLTRAKFDRNLYVYSATLPDDF